MLGRRPSVGIEFKLLFIKNNICVKGIIAIHINHTLTKILFQIYCYCHIEKILVLRIEKEQQ